MKRTYTKWSSILIIHSRWKVYWLRGLLKTSSFVCVTPTPWSSISRLENNNNVFYQLRWEWRQTDGQYCSVTMNILDILAGFDHLWRHNVKGSLSHIRPRHAPKYFLHEHLICFLSMVDWLTYLKRKVRGHFQFLCNLAKYDLLLLERV